VPAGIGYIAQALYENSIGYEYFDMRTKNSFGRLRKIAIRFNPDLIGFSMSSLGYRHTYSIMSRIKELLPGARLVVGGHHATVLREKVLEACAAIDFAVISDGERTIIELCKNDVPLVEIKGLVFRNGKDIVFTGERPPVMNLDELAFPRYEKFDFGNYSRQIPIHFSRGCVHKCIFCPNRVLARSYRTRSEKNFVDEIEYWYGRGIRQFAIDDDNFTLHKKKVLRVCDEIERRGLKDLFIRCSNGIRADSVDRELLIRLKEIGVREIGFGVDGGNNKILKSLKKGETIETIDNAVRTACELGFDVKLFFLVGSPHETWADIEDSICFARKYPVARVNFNNPIPYPGTEMYDYVEDNKLFLVPPEEYLNNVAENKRVPLFETPELPNKERLQILKKCHKVEKEVMRNTVYRMFKRYPVIAHILRRIFICTLFEKLFFESLFFRKVSESIRCRFLLQK
jgi:radical SAM superfamily enzyme YgiQ (UPF0313 family)